MYILSFFLNKIILFLINKKTIKIFLEILKLNKSIIIGYWWRKNWWNKNIRYSNKISESR